MAIFNRNSKNQSGVSKELEEYYQNERRERFGVAWLLAFGTLVTTLLLASALFFGGRWLYRTVTKSDNISEVKKEPDQQIPGLSIDESPNKPGVNDSLPSATLQVVPSPNPSANNSAATSPTPPSSTVDLPRTGPEQDL